MKLILQKEIDTKIIKIVFAVRKIKIFLVFTHFSTFLKTTKKERIFQSSPFCYAQPNGLLRIFQSVPHPDIFGLEIKIVVLVRLDLDRHVLHNLQPV